MPFLTRVVLVLVAFVTLTASAEAKSVAVAPAMVKGTTATFPVAVAAEAVRKPRVIFGSRREPVSLERFQAAAQRGVLRYRVPRHEAKRLLRARLRYEVLAPREACALGAFGAATRPGACWRPYSDVSPFNTPVAPGAPSRGDSAQLIAELTAWGEPQGMPAGVAGTDADYGHPVYFSTAADPKYRIRCTGGYVCPIDGDTVHLPAGARAAGGSDGHLTVVDQTTGWEYDFWQVTSLPPAGGVLAASHGGRTRIGGDGLGSDGTASRFGGLAGIVRPEELAAGRIEHALFMTAPCDNGRFVAPAQKSGRSCAALGRGTRHALPMGSRVVLDVTPGEIEALAAPGPIEAILRAMATYGMFLGDTGGKSWGIQLESPASFTSLGHPDPFVALARDLRIPAFGGIAYFDLPELDWRRHLRVIKP